MKLDNFKNVCSSESAISDVGDFSRARIVPETHHSKAATFCKKFSGLGTHIMLIMCFSVKLRNFSTYDQIISEKLLAHSNPYHYLLAELHRISLQRRGKILNVWLPR